MVVCAGAVTANADRGGDWIKWATQLSQEPQAEITPQTSCTNTHLMLLCRHGSDVSEAVPLLLGGLSPYYSGRGVSEAPSPGKSPGSAKAQKIRQKPSPL